MKIILSAPSKTFFIGEYLSLRQGPALILNTPPRFELHAELNRRQKHFGFHPASPAGQYLMHHREFFQSYSLQFHDPHQGLGGFGASTAQFALLYVLRHLPNMKALPEVDIPGLIQTYRKFSWHGEGQPPSGADLVGQVLGGLSLYEGKRFHSQVFDWPFKESAFCLIRTGYSLPTHEHLRRLEPFDPKPLHRVALHAIKALEEVNAEALHQAINDYDQALQDQHLVLPQTRVFLNQLHQQPGVFAAKGCGALGADVILVCVDPEKLRALCEWATAHHLSVHADTQQLTKGVALVSANLEAHV